MKRKIADKARKIASHPATREAMRSLKPARTLWGVLGVVLFFILPEIVAFVWGSRIEAWCTLHLHQPHTLPAALGYKAIELLFTEGSWFNLLLGFALLVWLFF